MSYNGRIICGASCKTAPDDVDITEPYLVMITFLTIKKTWMNDLTQFIV